MIMSSPADRLYTQTAQRTSATTICTPYIGWVLIIIMITSCCSTDSERPHRCCQLTNNFGSRRMILPIYFIIGQGSAPKIAHSSVGPGPHLMHGSSAHPSPHPKRHFDRFSRSVGLTIMTSRPRCSNRPHLVHTCCR